MRESTIENSIVGLRSVVHKKAAIKNAVIMGADYFEFEAPTPHEVPLGIGEGSVVENAIIDKNARIGRFVTVKNVKGIEQEDGNGYYIREGIVIVPKDAVIPDQAVI